MEGQAHVHEVIVVDDRGPNPRGCCRARNKGAAQACRSATHLYFTDDDCILAPGCLARLCSAGLWDSPYTGATGGSCINMREPRFYTKTWRYLVNPLQIDDKGEIWDLSEFWVEDDRWWPVDHLRGGNILIRKKAFQQVHGFSDDYGPGSLRGETDLCLKLRAAGFRLLFNPVARVLHYCGARQLTAREKAYDQLWRRTWQPKKFLGRPRIPGLAPIVEVGTRSSGSFGVEK